MGSLTSKLLKKNRIPYNFWRVITKNIGSLLATGHCYVIFCISIKIRGWNWVWEVFVSHLKEKCFEWERSYKGKKEKCFC